MEQGNVYLLQELLLVNQSCLQAPRLPSLVNIKLFPSLQALSVG